MREFYFKDKNTNVAYRGIMPHNDIDCLPFDYYRISFAYNMANQVEDILKIKCPIVIPEHYIKKIILEETDKMIADKLKGSAPKYAIHQLFKNDTLSYKQQNKLLKNITLTSTDFLWLNKEAQDMGYLMDVYHEEKYPIKFDEKKHPVFCYQTEDGAIGKMGETDMTEGEMRALLEQRKVIQARVYHKDNIWHCFYFTFKGLAGEENGLMGTKPHYHYLSDKSGITWNDLMTRIKECDMPTSKVHIFIDRSRD